MSNELPSGMGKIEFRRQMIEAEMRRDFDDLDRRHKFERSRSRSETSSPQILVLTGDVPEYMEFIRQYDLSRQTYRFIAGPQDLIGYSWRNAVLVKVGEWQLHPVLQYANELLDPHFPGWNN